MKIIFMGTPDFAVPTLEKLIENYEVSLVITQPDKAKGRSGKLVYSPVKEVALAHGIEVYQPLKARDPECIERIRRENADLLVVAAYGQILPEAMLDIPKYGSVNVHASLLPKLRGAAPIQWAVLNGDEYAGITIMRVVKALDAGNIISQEAIKLDANETGGSLFDKMSKLGGELLVKTIPGIVDGSIKEIPQIDEESTYAPMLNKEMGDIDWTKSSVEIDRLVRGLYPWPGTYTFIGDTMYKISQIRVHDEKIAELDKTPGSIYSTKKNIYVRCGDGIIEVLRIQPSGKKMMDVTSFLLGHKLEGRFNSKVTPVALSEN